MNKKKQNNTRWQQRFCNFNKALHSLNKAISKNNLNELEEQGLIKAFEYTYELAWKTLQDLLREAGYQDIAGPKPVIEQSFQDGYITDGAGWAKMHQSRNLTSHTYDEKMAEEIIDLIKNDFYKILKDLQTNLQKRLE